MTSIFLLIFIVAIFIILLNFAWAGISAAPWLPSKRKDFKRILELAEVKNEDIVYDLGSGDGRWLFYFARNSPAKEIIGFEISILMFIFSWIKKLFGKFPQVKIRFVSLYESDLTQVDVVLCFLTPIAMRKLWPKLKGRMKSGSRLISYAFKLPDKNPEIISKLEKKDISIYVYKF